MTIEYNKSQTSEVNARKIYDELIDLPRDIRVGLQKLICLAPIVKTSHLLGEIANHNSRIMDLSDLED
ncbi:MAG: hypothetical protein AABX99_03170 [Nanoarchaeota archaeon]